MFKLDTNSNSELQLVNVDPEEKTKPAHYPSLLQTGYFCARTVSTKRRMTQENLPDRAHGLAKIIISYLHDNQFTKSLAQTVGSPIHTCNGDVQRNDDVAPSPSIIVGNIRSYLPNFIP